MPMNRTLLCPALLALSASALVPSLAAAQEAQPAPADPKVVCSQAFEQAQRQRNESHYVAANQEVLKCANPACGEALFQECTKLYTELQGAIPSVVFAARDKNGNELSDVRVTIDGQPFTEQLDGKPVQLDPGSHTFGFTAQDYPPIERVAVIRAGERFRPVSVVFERPEVATPKAPEPVTAPAAAPLPAEPGARKVPIATYVLGGVGVVAVGGFVGFRLVGSSDYDQLERDCAPNCPDSDVNRVKRSYLISNVALGVGAAAFVGAVAVYLAAPRESAPTTALQVAPTDGGMAARPTTRF